MLPPCSPTRRPVTAVPGRRSISSAPQRREPVRDLGPGEGQDQERLVGGVAQGGVDDAHAEVVGSVQVLEHERDREDPAAGGEEGVERLLQLVGHVRGVEAGGPQLRAVVVGERCTDKLAEEQEDPRALGGRHDGVDGGGQAGVALGERFTAADADGVLDGVAEQRERRVDAERVADCGRG